MQHHVEETENADGTRTILYEDDNGSQQLRFKPPETELWSKREVEKAFQRVLPTLVKYNQTVAEANKLRTRLESQHFYVDRKREAE